MSTRKYFFCDNDKCGHYQNMIRKGRRGKKARYILCDGIIGDDSYIRVSCPHCRNMYYFGVKEKPKVDTAEPSPLDLLKSVHLPGKNHAESA